MLNKFIPNEIWCKIFNYLDNDEIKKCKLTCSQWNNICCDSNEVIVSGIINSYGKLFGPAYIVNFENLEVLRYLLRNVAKLDMTLAVESCINKEKWEAMKIIINNYQNPDFITNIHIRDICRMEKVDIFWELCNRYLLSNIDFDTQLLYIRVDKRAEFIKILYSTYTYKYISIEYLYFCVMNNHFECVKTLLEIPEYIRLIRTDLAYRINTLEMLKLLWEYLNLDPNIALLDFKDIWNEQMLLYLLEFENVQCNLWLLVSACSAMQKGLINRILQISPENIRYILLLALYHNNEEILELIYENQMLKLDSELLMAVLNNDYQYIPVQAKNIGINSIQAAKIVINTFLLFVNRNHPECISLFVDFYRKRKMIIQRNSEFLKLLSIDIYPFLNRFEKDILLESFDDNLLSTFTFYGTENMVLDSINIISNEKLKYLLNPYIIQRLIKFRNKFISNIIANVVKIESVLLNEIIANEPLETIKLFLKHNSVKYNNIVVAIKRDEKEIFDLVIKKYRTYYN